MNRKNEVSVSPDEVINTSRCRLRYPDETDIPHIWSASRTPHFNDGLRWQPPSDIAELKEPLQSAQASFTSGIEYSWTIESREDRDFVGWISIRKESGEREWSIGFWVHPTKQGQGFATECAAAMVEFGFSRLGAEVITARHATWNVASGRVLKRIGMTRTRLIPRGIRKNDEWVEELEYEIRFGDTTDSGE